MGKKLAIKGHPTRGSEVIEILEMLGGKNRWTASGGLPNLYYFISNECILYSSQIEKDVVIFTLEEFLEKYPYKIGDKAVYIDDNDIVVISEIEWDNIVGDIFYNVKRIDEDDCFLCPPELLKPYKEEINMKDKEDKLFDSIIWHLRNSINNGKQDISGGDCERYFRELVDKVKETITPTPDITANVTDKNNCDIQCPDGYEFYDENGNLIGPKVMMKPKKPTYPKTIKECVKCINAEFKLDSNCYEAKLFANFYRLIICRDAYWKIAGEQMGLNKPWEPEYVTLIDNNYHTIQTFNGEIVKSGTSHRNAILAFPTVEMRDAFYENFKDLIESCKELL